MNPRILPDRPPNGGLNGSKRRRLNARWPPETPASSTPLATAAGPGPRLIGWFLGAPLSAKIIGANAALVSSAVVTLGAVLLAGGTVEPAAALAEWTAALALGAAAIAAGVNVLLLRPALAPLRELERVADAVEHGDWSARARLGLVRDPQTARVAVLTNRILDAEGAQRGEVEHAARQLAQLSTREIQAREEERRAVAAELREEIGQTFTAVTVGLRSLVKTLESDPLDGPAARARAEALIEVARSAFDLVEARAQGLRPSALDDLGLIPALRSAVGRWSRALEMPVLLDADGAGPVSGAVGVVLYRVAEEAVANAARHAGATRIELRLRTWPAVAGGELSGCMPTVELLLADDGIGFDVEAARRRDSLGLLGMRERLALVGGTIEISSSAGRGTTIVARAPARF